MSDQDLTPEGTNNEATSEPAVPDVSQDQPDAPEISEPAQASATTNVPAAEPQTEAAAKTAPEPKPTPPAAKKSAAKMAKKNATKNAKQQRTRKVTVGQVLTGLLVVALAVGLGLFGQRVTVPIPEVLAMGTDVSVDAASAALICPTPVAEAKQPKGQDNQELSNAGNNKTEDGSISQDAAEATDQGAGDAGEEAEEDAKPADDFDADQGTTKNTVQTALLGRGGEVSYLDLGVPTDIQSTEESDQPFEPQVIDPVSALEPSAQSTMTGFNSGLAISTVARALTDPAKGQFTAATQSSVTSEGDALGIAAATCGTAATEHWLVGGGTSLGTSSKLVVQNPGLTAATVTLTVWGPGGRVPLSGLETLLVPAGKQVSVFLEGIAAEQRRTAVHVSSTGSLVSAYLQVNTLDGITAKGIDYVTPGSAPARVQVMTGVTLTGSEGTTGEPSVVRIVSPDFTEIVNLGDETAEEAADVGTQVIGTAAISLLGPEGRFALFGADQIDLTAGAVTDVELTGVPAGNYTVVIDSEVPIIAATRVSIEGTQDPERPLFGIPQDFAWIHSSDVLSGPEQGTEGGPADGQVAAMDELLDQTALQPRSVSSVVATIADLESKVVLAALPNVTDTADLPAALAKIPHVYATDAQAESEQETAEEQALREAWVADQRVAITTYSEAGAVLEQREIKLAVGQTLELEMTDLGGDQVHAVLVEPQQDAIIDWAVVTTSSDLNAAIGVLRPVVAEDEPMEVRVTRSLSVGIK
ncbi:DUF5719 family protein [Jonesiaceae bacterium BS-20]|uniref:DUF5719 family protein n=1 Tax=Jonesiaceae bacterium BS-20 TaxID=3120821 RepID=A0AAU7DVU7_9MICO